jgi:hypothetical protein
MLKKALVPTVGIALGAVGVTAARPDEKPQSVKLLATWRHVGNRTESHFQRVGRFGNKRGILRISGNIVLKWVTPKESLLLEILII